MSSPVALILDFGGVVSRTLFETHAMTERALGLAPGSLTWRGPFEPASDTLWAAMQNGELTEREYWSTRTGEVADLLGKNWTEMAQFVSAARGSEPEAVIRPEALRAIDAAYDAGSRLAILSNELDLFYGAEFRGKLPFLQKFDVICDATYTGILKPDSRAYLDCSNELGVSPDNCVFVDDQGKNVRGAAAAGMQAVHFDVREPETRFSKALAMLIEPSEDIACA